MGSLVVNGARERLLRDVEDLLCRRVCGECALYASSMVVVFAQLVSLLFQKVAEHNIKSKIAQKMREARVM